MWELTWSVCPQYLAPVEAVEPTGLTILSHGLESPRMGGGSQVRESQNPCPDIRTLNRDPEARTPTFKSGLPVARGLRLGRLGFDRWTRNGQAEGAARRGDWDPRPAQQPSSGFWKHRLSGRASSPAGPAWPRLAPPRQPTFGRVPPTFLPHWGNSI